MKNLLTCLVIVFQSAILHADSALNVQLGRVFPMEVPDGIQAALANGVYRGKMVYAGETPAPRHRTFLGLYTNETPENVKTVMYPLMISGTDTTAIAFDPQFSSDGNLVLFKIGVETQTYRLFVLDLQANKVSPVSRRELKWTQVAWSPNGKYLAYVVGGDPDENGTPRPLRLMVNEWRLNDERLVVKNEGVRDGFSWAAPNTLYFTALPTTAKAHPGPVKSTSPMEEMPGVAQQKFSEAVRPNIYVANPAADGTFSFKLVMIDGCRPEPSPDGKRLAFFGLEFPDQKWPLPANWLDLPGGHCLTVSNADGTGRRTLNLETHYYRPIWLQNNRLLWCPKYVSATPPELRREVGTPVLKGRLEPVIFNADEGSLSRLGKYESFRLGVNTNETGDFNVRALRLSSNGRALFVAAQSGNVADASNASFRFNSLGTLTAIVYKADSSEPTSLAQIRHAHGMDWFEISAAATP